MVSPHGYLRPSVPRAAFSHSCGVGKRLPAQRQYASARYQSIQLAGWLGRSSRHWLGELSTISIHLVKLEKPWHPPSATHLLKAVAVTSVRSMQKVAISVALLP